MLLQQYSVLAFSEISLLLSKVHDSHGEVRMLNCFYFGWPCVSPSRGYFFILATPEFIDRDCSQKQFSPVFLMSLEDILSCHVC